ncbi:MAG: single-stranded DNA-binding protein [Fusobacteria bacterium]|nr:single-stranded DNA-binding protein [Fusobacteriota bacterium]
MYNKVTLVGRLVRDPELRYTPGGKAVANFTIAVDRGFKDKETGESSADFIKVTTWDKQAENVSNMLKKGRLVLVDGSIRTGSYEKDGQKVYTTEVHAVRVVFLDRGEKVAEGGSGSVEDVFFGGQGIDDDDVPF